MDMGSLNTRAGFSGDDMPRYHCLSQCGVQSEPSEGAMQVEREKYIYGDEHLYKHRDNFEVRDVIRNGSIPNYDAYQGLVEHCYK
jgi:actin-related protein